MPEFERTLDTNGEEVWRCKECSGFKRGPYPPRSHKCSKQKKSGGASSLQGRPVSQGVSVTDTEQTPGFRDGNVSVESVLSPFVQATASSTPSGPPPTGGSFRPAEHNLLQEQMRLQMENQFQIQQQMMQQQQSLQQLLQDQQIQMQQNLALQREENASKDLAMRDFIEESRRKERELIEMFQKQAIDAKRIPCPKWGKEETYKSFSARLQHWDKHYKSKGKYLELLESLQETGRTTEKSRIELEVLNKLIDPDDDDVIAKIITNLSSIFGRVKMDKIIEH